MTFGRNEIKYSSCLFVCDIAFIRRTTTGVRDWSWVCGGGAAESRVYPTMPCPCTHHPTSSASINCACSARCSCQTMCLSYQKAVPRAFVDCPDHLTVAVLQTILRCIRISLVTHLWVAICPVGIGYRAARLQPRFGRSPTSWLKART